MKKLLGLLMATCALSAHAATPITTPTVSGHWTLAGSPYQVYNDISVDATSVLTIDPGVTVSFMGWYYFNVDGMLRAMGTAAQPISFTVGDTTGYYDSTTNTGAWRGIEMGVFGGIWGAPGPDSSVLNYCNVSYTKSNYAGAMTPPYTLTLHISRALSVNNCTFLNNQCENNSCIWVSEDTGQTVTFDGCDFHDNNFSGFIIELNGTSGGNCIIRTSKVHDNISNNLIIYSIVSSLVIEKSEVYNNRSNDGIILFSTSSGALRYDTVRNNKIHDNVSQLGPAVTFYGGLADIDANLICNNHHLAGTAYCGAKDGGGGIHIGFNGGGTTYYTVHNNIIANNYSPFRGGAIYIDGAPATICNNQIINNNSYYGGAIFAYLDPTLPVTIKNNIFYGNITDSLTTSAHTPNVSGYALGFLTLNYSYNWSEHPTAFDLDFMGSIITNTGDTTTNVRGTDPMLVSPTLSTGYTVNALASDFSLKPASPCIDKGDTSAGAYPSTTDYLGLSRISGSRIDIGAIEYVSRALGIQPTVPVQGIMVYPNPASDVLTVEGSLTGNVTVTNMLGQVLLQSEKASPKSQMNIATLPAGIYIVNVGHTTASKFIKE